MHPICRHWCLETEEHFRDRALGTVESPCEPLSELAALGRPVLTDQRFGDIISQTTMSSPTRTDLHNLRLADSIMEMHNSSFDRR